MVCDDSAIVFGLRKRAKRLLIHLLRIGSNNQNFLKIGYVLALSCSDLGLFSTYRAKGGVQLILRLGAKYTVLSGR